MVCGVTSILVYSKRTSHWIPFLKGRSMVLFFDEFTLFIRRQISLINFVCLNNTRANFSNIRIQKVKPLSFDADSFEVIAVNVSLLDSSAWEHDSPCFSCLALLISRVLLAFNRLSFRFLRLLITNWCYLLYYSIIYQTNSFFSCLWSSFSTQPPFVIVIFFHTKQLLSFVLSSSQSLWSSIFSVYLHSPNTAD